MNLAARWVENHGLAVRSLPTTRCPPNGHSYRLQCVHGFVR